MLPPFLVRRCWAALGASLSLWAITVFLFWATSAHAGQRPVYHQHTLTISTAACPTGNPGTAPDGVTWGISLAGVKAWSVTVCAEDGETISGTGSLKVCTYSAEPWGPGEWVLSPRFTWIMTADDSTTAEDKRCIEMETTTVGVDLSDRVFVYPSTDFGVSAGTTLEVHLKGAQ